MFADDAISTIFSIAKSNLIEIAELKLEKNRNVKLTNLH